MKAFEIKEFDILHVQRAAAVKTAKLLKIEYCELMDYLELQGMIKEKDEGLYKMLMDFTTAYWNYYFCVNSINSVAMGNKIEPKDADLLKEHIKQKNELRTALMIEIKKRKKQN
jgi:hypothetical protein